MKLFFTAAFFGGFASGQMLVTGPWLMLELTNMPQDVASVLISSALPSILLSPIIGVYVDRFDRKRIAITMDVLRSLLLLGLFMAVSAGKATQFHLCLATFFIAMCSEVFRPTSAGLLKEMAGQRGMLKANSSFIFFRECGYLVGTGAAGVLISLISAGFVVGLSGTYFAMSAVMTLFVKRKKIASTLGSPLPGAMGQKFFSELLDGLRYCLGHPTLCRTYFVMSLLLLPLRTAPALLAPFCRFDFPIGAKGLGYIESGWALGAIIGSALLATATDRLGRSKTLNYGIFGLFAGFIIFATSRNLPQSVLGYFIVGCFGQSWCILLSKAQEDTETRFIGRVQMSFNFVFSLVLLAFFYAYGQLSGIVSVRWLYMASALLLPIALALLVSDRKSA